MARENLNIKGVKMTKQTELITTTKEEREELHNGRLYPESLDQAIHSEEPLIYSREKLIEIMTAELGYPTKFIATYIDTEVRAKFNLI